MSYTKKAVSGTAVLFTFTTIAALIAYTTRIVLARSLSPADYGLFFSVFVFVSFFSLVRGLGLEYAVVSKIPSWVVKNRPNKIKTALIYTVLIQFILAGAIAVILWVFSGFLADYYFKNRLAEVILLFLLAMFVLDVFAELLKKTFQAFQKSHFFAIIEFSKNLFIFVLVIIFLKLGLKIFSPALAYPLASLLVILIFFPFFLKIFPIFRHKFVASKKMVKGLFYFGVPSIMFLVGHQIISYSDILILTYFRELVEVGVYNVVIPTAIFSLFFSRAVTWVIMPMSSELWTKKEFTKLSDGLRRLHKFVLIIITPAIIGLLFFSGLFLKIFFGPDYISGALPLQIILVGTIFYALAQVNSGVFIGIGQPKIIAKTLLSAAVFNTILNLALIPFFGMYGAAVATTLSYILALFLSIRYVSSVLSYKFPFTEAIKVLFLGVIFVLLIFLLKTVLPFQSYIESVISLSVAGLAYVFFLFLFKLTTLREVKELAKNVLGRQK